ncbi:hypothetical protein J8J27_32570, partial [Mycobacterium tuberculosis]|nr:hypothetical protein [Mycobacterium tuberculosis]
MLELLAGDRGKAVADKVAETVTKVTKTADAAAAQQAVDTDPVVAAQLRMELARIAVEEKKLAAEVEAKRRQDEA